MMTLNDGSRRLVLPQTVEGHRLPPMGDSAIYVGTMQCEHCSGSIVMMATAKRFTLTPGGWKPTVYGYPSGECCGVEYSEVNPGNE